MKKVVLFLLLISVNSIIAQDYINLFKNDLTDRIRFESYPKQLVNKDLDMAAKIHPELLYYYITYHNLKYDGKIEPEYRLYDKELGEARSRYIKARKEWFRLGEEHLKIMEKDSNQLAGEIQYLNKNNPYSTLAIGQICDSCYKTDTNRLNYFVYKYCMKDEDMVYLPNEDYASLRKEYETKIKISVEEGLNELSRKSLSFGSAEDAYNQLIGFWYLFPGTNEKGPIQAHYTKLIFNDYYKDYKIADTDRKILTYEIVKNKLSNFKIWVSYNSYFLKSFNYKYTSNIPAEAKLDNNFNFTTSQISVGLGQTFELFEGNRMFSKLTLEAGFGMNITQKTLFLSYPRYLQELPPYTAGSDNEIIYLTNKMVPEENTVKMEKIYGLSLKVKTPLFYFGHNLSLGIGGVADVFLLQYTANMDFYVMKLWRGLNYSGQVVTHPERYYYVIVKGEKADKVVSKYYPILTAEYKFLNKFGLNCEASLNYYVLGFSYNFLQ